MTVSERDTENEARGAMPDVGKWLRAKDGTLYLRCPNGHVNTIMHAIWDNGILNPSYQCSHHGCDFHVQPLQLKGWTKA